MSWRIWLTTLVLVAGCGSPDPETVRRASLAQSIARWRGCAPQGETGHPVKVAVASILTAADGTSVRLVAYATDQPGELPLPLYYLSRGRWLIAESGRAYLLDQDCREYRLNDVERSAPLPEPGLLRLKAGQSFEVTLRFPPVDQRASLGWLVYGDRTLPLVFVAPEPLSPSTTPSAERPARPL